MEWVETTGRTLEEAKEAALDQLGVDETDAEFEVIEQPKAGLFGRMRGEARVRARVKPTAPRAKEDRRDRRRRAKPVANGREDASPSGGSGGSAGTPVTTTSAGSGRAAGASRTTGAESVAAKATREAGGQGSPGAESGPAGAGDSAGAGAGAGDSAGSGSSGSRRRRRRSKPSGGHEGGAPERGDTGGGPGGRGVEGGREPVPAARERDDLRSENNQRREGSEVEVPLQEQGRVAEDFLSGLINEFGLSADVALNEREEENLDIALTGQDLGLLIGQKGATLLAIQDLTRTVVQHSTGASNGRIHVDIGGYRQKRSEALAKFARDVAAKVQQSGQRTVLEPMSAADRKIVHDAITGIEGVSTISEGEDPRRRVVVIPSD